VLVSNRAKLWWCYCATLAAVQYGWRTNCANEATVQNGKESNHADRAMVLQGQNEQATRQYVQAPMSSVQVAMGYVVVVAKVPKWKQQKCSCLSRRDASGAEKDRHSSRKYVVGQKRTIV